MWLGRSSCRVWSDRASHGLVASPLQPASFVRGRLQESLAARMLWGGQGQLPAMRETLILKNERLLPEAEYSSLNFALGNDGSE